MPEETAEQAGTKLLVVSESLWEQLKLLALKERTTLREVTERAVRRELKRQT